MSTPKPFAVPAKTLLKDNPGTAAYLGWKKYPGSTTKMSYPVPVNKSLFRPLEGSRLAVVLHEIRDRFGKVDPELHALADKAIKGYGDVGPKGYDTFHAIRDRLAKIAPNYKRAGEIANGYNWHRVGAGLQVDEAVRDYVNSIAKDRIKANNEHLRAAHNLFGIGSGDRGKASPEARAAFWKGLKDHVRNKAKEVYNINRQQGYTPAEFMNDKMLARSLRRLAENEEHVHGVLGTGGLKRSAPTDKVTAEHPAAPAYYPTKAGGVRVNPRARASQFARAVGRLRRYGLIDKVRGVFATTDPGTPVNGIRFTSHPNGAYDANNHLGANAEYSAVRHALRALRIIPDKTPNEGMPEYTNGVDRLVNFFVNKAREHVHGNPADLLSKYYTDAADKMKAAPEGPGIIHGKRIDLPSLPMGITGLSTAVAPLLRKIAAENGLRRHRGLIVPEHPPSLPPEPEPGYEVVDKHDLNESATPSDYEDYAASILHELDKYHKAVTQPVRQSVPFGSEKPLYHVVDTGDATPDDFTIPQDLQLPGQSPDVAEVEAYKPRKPATRFNYPAVRQDIADHLAAGGTRESTTKMLTDKHGLTRGQASAQIDNYHRLKAKPAPASVPRKPTGRLKPLGEKSKTRRFERPVRYAMHYMDQVKDEPKIHDLIHSAITTKDNTPIHAAADLMEEHGQHPIAPVLRRIANGEGEYHQNSNTDSWPWRPVNQLKWVASSADETQVANPGLRAYDFFSLPGSGGHGNGAVNYIHLPQGHFYHVHMYNDPTDDKTQRHFVLPVGEHDVRAYIDGLKESGSPEKASAWESMLSMTPNPLNERQQELIDHVLAHTGNTGPARMARRLAALYAKKPKPEDPGKSAYVFKKEGDGYGVYRSMNRNYHVTCDKEGNATSCTCPDHEYRGGICKHMRWVQEMKEGPAKDPAYDSRKGDEPVKNQAYRAPAGGMVVRGTAYPGGSMVPDMTGKFMNPPKRRDPRVGATTAARVNAAKRKPAPTPVAK